MEFRFDLADFISFRDHEECARVRVIRREEICKHSNPEFKIRIIEDRHDFYVDFALDIVRRIKEAGERGERFVAIFPVGPMPQYKIVTKLINQLRISCKHVHSFNMDEYADQEGNTAPPDWPGSFQKAMMENFFLNIDEDLRPPLEQIHFPTKDCLSSYGEMIEELGGADICYGGIGWCGHIAFWESHLGEEFGGDLQAFKEAGSRCVKLHPMTIMQNALHSFGGDWSQVPPKANTIGPAQIVRAKDRSFWLDGDLGGGISWQRFIARLVAHGPVTPLVPGSILQTLPGTYTLLGGVADNVEIRMA
ncbi:glucosamine-6-phosphate deaminase [Candidatus Hakubella thermalkaliphila]|uniref:Glucosamine-6-phosphate deaminase n=1 Tax=Candidatus Hakubella thermalkaliphila TaxID=2754717 RepID=A0A6V8PHN9_9ACTN|nr:glucosamine-6-phosphate deaminase [Candidatus Hakubella thermalkaliphila]